MINDDGWTDGCTDRTVRKNTKQVVQRKLCFPC